MPISNDHVNAINLIEVDFYKCAAVDAAWKDYKTHLYTGPEDDQWRAKRDKLLATLLFQMGKVLGFDMPAMELFQGGYAPKGWEYRDNRAGTVAEYVVALSQGKASLPMNVIGFPADEELAKLQLTYFKLFEERMREGKGWPVEIVNNH